jgi:hypothetical protein
MTLAVETFGMRNLQGVHQAEEVPGATRRLARLDTGNLPECRAIIASDGSAIVIRTATAIITGESRAASYPGISSGALGWTPFEITAKLRWLFDVMCERAKNRLRITSGSSCAAARVGALVMIIGHPHSLERPRIGADGQDRGSRM